MPTDTMIHGSSFDRYISGIRSVWTEVNDPELPFKVKALMEELLSTTDQDEPWMAHMLAEAKIAKELYRDPDHGFYSNGPRATQGPHQSTARSRPVLGGLRGL